MREFSIARDPNAQGCNIFKKSTIMINPGVTVLVGCNGMGKSTLLVLIEQHLKRNSIPVLYFDNFNDGNRREVERAAFHGDFSYVATAKMSSEGENINMALGQFAAKIGQFCRANPGAKEVWILLDAVDSGLSIDNVVELKSLFSLIIKSNPASDIYIVVAANEYELARNENCFDVYRGRYINFATYDDYRNFIIKTREEKDRRVYKSREKIS